MPYPSIRILEGHDRRLRTGSPWLYSNELQMDQAARELPAGTVVRLVAQDGKGMALAFFNPHSLIAGRILTRSTDATVDASFVERRLARALTIRERLYDRPFYRLVHAEADGLPGLVVDRFGDTVVAQVNSAGLARLQDELVAGLQKLLQPTRVVLRNDTGFREMEGLDTAVETIGKPLDGPVTVEEGGLEFLADPETGQKTGWYYDQRENRQFTARLAEGADVLDLYSYGGGFGFAALAAGAKRCLMVDSSERALKLAEASAERQGVADRVELRQSDAFEALEELQAKKRRFDLVVADPPPFVRSKKDLPVGLKGYQKLAKGAASVTAEHGYLCIACCSHNVPADEFARSVYAGIRSAGRGGTLLTSAGAAPDHPTHPALPESAYLKFLAFALD